MRCFYPLVAFKIVATGAVVFKRPSSAFLDLILPCGQCSGCRLERSRQWAVRCMHEASLYDENSFITLTYDDEHLPEYGTLDKSAFPKFMKRLRKRAGVKVRYYHAGEYGSLFGRPHYHACLFGFDFADKVYRTERNGFPVWSSELLGELWSFGRSEIGTVTFESAAYVARYIMDKVTGKDADVAYAFVDEEGEVRHLTPEYTTMSRRPGIGRPWLDMFGAEVYPADGVVVAGKLCKPPRFYDTSFELIHPGMLDEVRAARRARRRVSDNTPARLEVAAECANARLALYPRKGL